MHIYISCLIVSLLLKKCLKNIIKKISRYFIKCINKNKSVTLKTLFPFFFYIENAN